MIQYPYKIYYSCKRRPNDCTARGDPRRFRPARARLVRRAHHRPALRRHVHTCPGWPETAVDLKPLKSSLGKCLTLA
jgi:hypothetical protein